MIRAIFSLLIVAVFMVGCGYKAPPYYENSSSQKSEQ